MWEHTNIDTDSVIVTVMIVNTDLVQRLDLHEAELLEVVSKNASGSLAEHRRHRCHVNVQNTKLNA